MSERLCRMCGCNPILTQGMCWDCLGAMADGYDAYKINRYGAPVPSEPPGAHVSIPAENTGPAINPEAHP